MFKRFLRRRNSFTLIELLAAVTILMITASLAVVGFQGYLDQAAMLQDETNMMILQMAVKINAVETGTIAGSLSELQPIDLEKAYAAVAQGKRPYTMLAYVSEGWRSLWGGSIAEAADSFLPARYYNRDLKTITCPKDPVKPTGFDANDKPLGGASYAISAAFKGQKPVSFLLANPDKTLIYEVDKSSSNQREAYRHDGGKKSVRVTAAGKTYIADRGKSDGDSGGGNGGG